MARRQIGRERFWFDGVGTRNDLDDLAGLVDWTMIDHHLVDMSLASRGEAGWPPPCLLKAPPLGRWHDLGDVKLAGALDDRALLRRFRGLSRNAPTPERTALVRLVRFRRASVSRKLAGRLFDSMTTQLRACHVSVRRGPLVDATIIASASREDDDARWIKHDDRKAVHGEMAHVASDETTDLVDRIVVTDANVNDGKAGCDVVPDGPERVHAGSAHQGPHQGPGFRHAVEEKGGPARVVVAGVWARNDDDAAAGLQAIHGPIHRVRCRVEKILVPWKRRHGLRAVPRRGLGKADLHVPLTAIAYTLKRGLSLGTSAAA